jgi:hypothetical protein
VQKGSSRNPRKHGNKNADPVGASMLAMVVNDNAGDLTPRGALGFFASLLAPTEEKAPTKKRAPIEAPVGLAIKKSALPTDAQKLLTGHPLQVISHHRLQFTQLRNVRGMKGDKQAIVIDLQQATRRVKKNIAPCLIETDDELMTPVAAKTGQAAGCQGRADLGAGHQHGKTPQ